MLSIHTKIVKLKLSICFLILYKNTYFATLMKGYPNVGSSVFLLGLSATATF